MARPRVLTELLLVPLFLDDEEDDVEFVELLLLSSRRNGDNSLTASFSFFCCSTSTITVCGALLTMIFTGFGVDPREEACGLCTPPPPPPPCVEGGRCINGGVCAGEYTTGIAPGGIVRMTVVPGGGGAVVTLTT